MPFIISEILKIIFCFFYYFFSPPFLKFMFFPYFLEWWGHSFLIFFWNKTTYFLQRKFCCSSKDLCFLLFTSEDFIMSVMLWIHKLFMHAFKYPYMSFRTIIHLFLFLSCFWLLISLHVGKNLFSTVLHSHNSLSSIFQACCFNFSEYIFISCNSAWSCFKSTYF